MRSIADPNRTFKLALSSTRLLGILSTGFGLVTLIAFGFFNRLPQFRIYFELLASIVWLLPGVAFLLAAILMKDARRSAVVLAIVTAAVQLLIAVACFVANFIFPPISLVPVVMCIAWVAALVGLIVNLRQAYSVIPIVDLSSHHGFEMIQNKPMKVLPAEGISPENHANETVRGK